MSGQDTYTLHKPAPKRFPRNPYTVTNIDDVWEMDLADLSSLSKHNNKFKYLLNVRHIFPVCLERSTGTFFRSALKFLFLDRKALTIKSDKGTEFPNATVQQYHKCQGVSFHTTKSRHKGRHF